MPIALPREELWARSAYDVHNPSANDLARLTVTPASGERAQVDWILPSYSAPPDINDTVTVSVGGTNVSTWRPGDRATVQGPQLFGPWIGDADEAIVVTVSEPLAATVSIAIKYRKNATITKA